MKHAIDRERQSALKTIGTSHTRRFGAALAGVASLVLLSGCMASPTYGTDKTANEQLVDDLTSVLSLGPRSGPEIEYTPRPELVRPSSTDVLPMPQEDVTESEGSDWPESPEQRLARVRAEATENRDNPNFVSPVRGGGGERRQPFGIGERNKIQSAPLHNNARSREEVNERIAARRQGSQTSRRYLSEPPLDYRQPSESAPVGDVGEDEWKKERRRERATGGGRSWRDYIPRL